MLGAAIDDAGFYHGVAGGGGDIDDLAAFPFQHMAEHGVDAIKDALDVHEMILEGEKNKLSEAFILKIYKAIHQESINHQNKVITKK